MNLRAVYIYQPARFLLYELIRKHSSLITGRVLDVGAGPNPRYKGLFTTTEYVTMDIVSFPGIDIVGTAERIPAPDGHFDSIVCTETISDVFDLPEAFSEFNRVLRPGGRALISAGCLIGLNIDVGEYWRFTPNSLKKLAEDAGFEVDVFEQRGNYWSVKAQLVISYVIRKYEAYSLWYGRLFSLWARLYGNYCMHMDSHVREDLKGVWTNGYMMVIRKGNEV